MIQLLLSCVMTILKFGESQRLYYVIFILTAGFVHYNTLAVM